MKRTFLILLALLAFYSGISFARISRGVSLVVTGPYVVQKCGNYATNIGGTSQAVTVTCPLPVDSGDAVAIAITYNGGFTPTISSIVDNESGTYTTALTPFQSSNSGFMALVMKGNVTNVPSTFTITIGQGTSGTLYVGAEVYEVSGLGSSPTLDASTANSGVFGISFNYSFTTTASNEFALAAYGPSGECTYVTLSGPFTSDNCFFSVDGAGGAAHAALASAGPQAFTGTNSSSQLTAVQLASWIPSGGLSITTASLTAPAVGSAMSQTLSITGGSGSYACSTVSATPNFGLWNYITPSCVVSGTPEIVEAESVTYQVTDTSTGYTAQKTFAFTPTNSGSLSILSPTSISGPSSGYTAYRLKTSGGLAPYWYTTTAGFPCTVTYDGVVECAAGSNQSIPVTVTDQNGATASQTESLTVNSTLVMAGVDNTDGLLRLPPAIVGNYYAAQLNAFAGSGSGYTYTATGGLPSWAALSSAGLLYGTPTQSGGVEVALKVTDSSSNTATATGLMNVSNNASVSRPSYNTASGFFQVNGKLYDPNGKLFIIRGDNQLHYNSSASSGLPPTGANTVRIWDGACTASNYTSLIAGYVANGIFPIATVGYVPTNSTTCSGTETSGDTSPTDLASVVSWWTANESSFAPYMNEMAINIANEWGPAYSTTWESSYASAISSLRTAGYTCPIIIDTGGSGQDPFDISVYGPTLEADDSQQNIIFSIHLYGQTTNYIGSITGVTSSGSNTVLTMSSTAANNPLWPYGGGSSYASGYTVSGVQGMTQLNGTWAGSPTLGGSSGAWTATLTVNSSGFSGYTGGGQVVANSSVSPNGSGNSNMSYQTMASYFASMGATSNVAVIFGEFGPGTDGSGAGIGPSPTNVSFQQAIGAAEAYGVTGWIEWAIDDNNNGGGMTSFAGWFGQTLTGPGVYARNAPTDLTAAGLDGITNPRYGLAALGQPAPVFH